MSLQQFIDAYIECALSASTDEDGDPLDYAYTIDGLSPEGNAKVREDCTAFYNENFADLNLHRDDIANGFDFWLTRNRHGAGFWDRGTGDVGRRLTDAAHAYGSCDLYVGDDGLIYCA